MSIARIQFLTKTDLGWHIRFTAQDDGFYAMLDKFREEQRRSAKINCHWNPSLFNGKGGWFVTERILLKYQDYFENYAAMRCGADVAYDLEHQEDLWGETKAERKEQDEERRRKEQDEERLRRFKEQAKQNEREQAWTRWDREREAYKERARQWEREQKQEQQSRPPTRPTSTGLTLTEALIELGFSALDKPTEIEVKKAFRQLAMKKHPDHGGSHEAMIKLNKAYQLVLWHAVQGVRA